MCTLKRWRCDLATSPYNTQADITDEPQPGIDLALPTSDIPADVCNELVDLYFDLIHDKQHIIFHRHSFVQEQRHGRAADFLVLGMVALMARFSSHPFFAHIPPWNRASPWLQRAVQAFNTRRKLIDIPSLQGCILLAFVSFVEMNEDQDTLLSAQAVRMVQVLQLPITLSSDPIMREIEIRLFWQCWMMDTWHSVQAQLPAQLRANPQFKRPLEEATFSAMRISNPPDLSTGNRAVQLGLRECSLWSLVLPLTEIHGQIVLLNDQLAHHRLSRSDIRSEVAALSSRLDQWIVDLPDGLRDTKDNWRVQTERGFHREFASMHMLYHHQSQLLYYQFLHKAVFSTKLEISGPDPEAFHYAARCKTHATTLSQIMWNTRSTSSTDTACLWSPLNGHLLVIATSIHLHSMLFDTDPTALEKARLIMEHNFIMLMQLQKYWPSLQLSLSRVRAFHGACLMERTHKHFDMDHWMITFLNRYKSTVPDRYAGFSNNMDVGQPIVGSPAANELWRKLFGRS
ncbi:hypothetical protein BJY01DRAFT_256123 [Aspergillus pseudoustus]|uniref:Xylanolytic transcriptional activator regulatory domain-containing protein n=1 Tax=Aspergillus pseudoustus TaxID=1810923 RepID=A0ABR4IE41_9EURO